MQEEVDKLTEEVIRCKLKAWEKIDDIMEHIGSETLRVDNLEASMVEIKKALKEHETQRANFSKSIKEDMSQLTTWFKKHDTKEMEKYDKIIEKIESLNKSISTVKHETDDNSKALMQKRIEEEKQRAIQEALEEREAPYKEYKKKAILTVVTIITGAIVAGVWKLIMFISHLDKLIGA